jgi:hypothetical protein
MPSESSFDGVFAHPDAGGALSRHIGANALTRYAGGHSLSAGGVTGSGELITSVAYPRNRGLDTSSHFGGNDRG